VLKVWLKVCVNGPRTRHEHPAVPQTAEQLTRAAAQLAPLGIQALHVYPKDEAGRDSLRPELVDSVVIATRDGAPGLPVGVTTGAWAMPDPAERVAATPISSRRRTSLIPLSSLDPPPMRSSTLC
jgi:uncharacterized protein (DUF849 family)